MIKKIKSFKVSESNLYPPFCLINKDIFVFYNSLSLYTFLLSNYSKEEFFIGDRVRSIIALNEKKFIVNFSY